MCGPGVPSRRLTVPSPCQMVPSPCQVVPWLVGMGAPGRPAEGHLLGEAETAVGLGVNVSVCRLGLGPSESVWGLVSFRTTAPSSDPPLGLPQDARNGRPGRHSPLALCRPGSVC